jgi:hypothetical protein
MKETECCGNPARCAFTVATGRCKAREEYEQADTRTPLEQFFSTFTPEELEILNAPTRKTRRRTLATKQRAQATM